MSVGYRVHGGNGFTGKEVTLRRRMEHIVVNARFFALAGQSLGIHSWLLKNILAEYKNSTVIHPKRLELYTDCLRSIYLNDSQKGRWVGEQMAKFKP